jgi:hypothetical protein
MAGFEVITYGRFWVIAEALIDLRFRPRYFDCAPGEGYFLQTPAVRQPPSAKNPSQVRKSRPFGRLRAGSGAPVYRSET